MSELDEAIERVINSVKPTDDPMTTLSAIGELRTVYEMDRANNPPEHLPSEESKWMATNDYGYSEAKCAPTPGVYTELEKRGQAAQAAMNEYSQAAQEMNSAQGMYEEICITLAEAKARYQKAFFNMNERIEEVNVWLQERISNEQSENKEG